jgi:hypothetical protein
MTERPDRSAFIDEVESREKFLASLRETIEFDPSNGDMTLRRGTARIILRNDGTVIVEGARILQRCEGSMRLQGATIDLN